MNIQSNPQQGMKDNQEVIVIGHIRFKAHFTKEIQDSFIESNQSLVYSPYYENVPSGKIPIRLLEKQNWSFKQYSQHVGKWETLIQYMDQVGCKQLTADNSHQQILLLLSIPTFTNLKTLHLSSCGIRNIQALNLLNAHNLEYLELFWNDITNMKAFNKTKWNRLKSMIFEDDFSIRMDCSRIKTNTYFGNNIYSQNYIPLSEDLRLLTKLETINVGKIKFNEIQKQINFFAIPVIRRKYPKR